ncbi:MAG TPA: type II toxin-antitoxin system VapC family toxin [Jatrophihabitans sp.]
MDASVLANALTDDGPMGARSRDELADDLHWAAPEHLVVEVFSAIRGRYLGRKISEQRAADAIAAMAETTIDVLGTAPLLSRMWQLRDNLTGYDAAYVAAAELYECALVTADERLSHAPDVRCEIRLAL